MRGGKEGSWEKMKRGTTPGKREKKDALRPRQKQGEGRAMKVKEGRKEGCEEGEACEEGKRKTGGK